MKKSQRGYVTLLAASYMSVLILVATGFLAHTLNANRQSAKAGQTTQARAIAEAGMEQTIWKLNHDSFYAGETATSFGTGQFTVTVESVSPTIKKVTSVGYVPNVTSAKRVTKTVRALITVDATVIAFNYGVQAGAGGLTMSNNASVIGNVYSNGPIVGSGGNTIQGDAFSAGPTGRIQSVTTTGNAVAHTLQSCTVNGNATYSIATSCAVTGTRTVTTTDPSSAPMPISQDQIDAWKNQASEGGTTVGNVTVSSNTIMGARKIQGNLTINGGVTLTLTGRIWVTGTITTGNNVHVALGPAYGAGQSELLIASGNIAVSNNLTNDSASQGRYILFLSESNSIDSNAPAITVSNNVVAAFFYAGDGLVRLQNNTKVKEVTAYKIQLDNNVALNYDTGLANAAFQGGPGASWAFDPGTYVID
jgi:Tfp pilus assembly protein PilX